jgi:trimeric autotransporter adhesin
VGILRITCSGGVVVSGGSQTCAEINSSGSNFSSSWEFDNPADYTVSSASALTITGGEARLVALDQTDNDHTASGFSGATLQRQVDSISGTSLLTPVTNTTSLHSSWTPQWDNLQGYWSFDGATGALANGTVIEDLKNSNDGVVINSNVALDISRLDHRVSQYVSFSSTSDDDYISIPDDPSLRFTSNFSIAAWIYYLGGNRYILEKGLNDDDNYGLYINTTLRFEFEDLGGTYRAFNTGYTFPTNRWVHLVFTFNDSANENRVYIDGELAITQSNNHSLQGTQTHPLLLGKQNYIPHHFKFNGRMDELALWNNNLTPEEVALIYNRQAPLYSGEQRSRVMDAGTTVSWDSLAWLTSLPFGKELTTTSESSVHYSSISADFSDQLTALYHLNGSGIPADDASVFDSSTNGFDGLIKDASATNDIRYSEVGIFGQSLRANGNDAVRVSDDPILRITDDLSVSLWVKASSGANRVLASKWRASAGQRSWKILNNSNAFIQVAVSQDGEEGTNWKHYQSSLTAIDNQWHHVAFTFEAGVLKLYVDGVEDLSPTLLRNDAITTIASTAADLVLGAELDSGDALANYMTGSLDEVSIWSRVLSAAEVLELYRRGANRIFHQVRTCAAADCSDQEAITGQGWLGPDGTAQSFFSELHNNSSIDGSGNPDGNVLSTSPAATFSDFLAAGMNLTDRQYFQYRTILESDDADDACNGGTQTCVPDLQSMQVGPNHYSASSPSVEVNTGAAISYLTLSSFLETKSGTCSITYQLSPDGTNYYYWDGGDWVTAVGQLNSNAASVVNAFILRFSDNFSPGTLTVRAFLTSDGSQDCQLLSLEVGGETL